MRALSGTSAKISPDFGSSVSLISVESSSNSIRELVCPLWEKSDDERPFKLLLAASARSGLKLGADGRFGRTTPFNFTMLLSPCSSVPRIHG